MLLSGRGQYCGTQWVPVARGVRRRADVDDPWRAALRAWLAILPTGTAFTHLTAARLLGWWLPPLPTDLPVFVALPPGAARVRRPGLVAVRRQVASVELLDGLPVEAPARVLATCARDLRLLDLICLADAARAGGASLDQLTPAPRARNGLLVHEALARSHDCADSILEVVLRELHRSCDVAVTPQHVVTDEWGDFVARGDLRLDGTRVLHEYDGADHLTRAQQRKDLRRSARLTEAGWIRRGYTYEDVLRQGSRILRDADAAIGRVHDPRRIFAWHQLLRESTFSPAGMDRLRRRLGPSLG